ncbi:TrbI/VirB10 family protein [Terricaulis sp.]|uniref:TrbI/VirB10 family protein n=1 Tax=Terricaulis sp. TaxID=2768686 RepID=UPI002AC58E8B|nr:TrbI/VirB10 family protein [Terricaulis sp.]MDZ4690304.1 TrbI/VirB10 family protein [Terricaulis sp.]
MSPQVVPPPANAPPDISIRAKPPSPRRLSRKVLLGGALTMAAIIAFAVLYGLSERPDRRRVADAQSAALAGPPDSIRLAPQSYGAEDLGAIGVDAEPNAADLEPPEGELWNAAPAPPPAREPPSAPDAEAVARGAPILFTLTDVEPGATATDSDRLPSRLSPPRSRFELLAGAVIPAALQTELNSDLPGRVIAQVTAPVFDSVTGRHLLIPQGARLIGAYDNATNYGDRRLLLVWQRLILPNGWSINLEGMQATDASGASGLRDRVDNHFDRLAAAIALSAIISVVANEAEDNEAETLTQSVGDAAAQQAAATGGRIVDRELAVRPTLRVRAGAPVRVLVTRDIVLRPYRE